MRQFMPKQYKKDSITIRVSTETIEKIDRIAAGLNLSRSSFINQCIEYALAQWEEENADQPTV